MNLFIYRIKRNDTVKRYTVQVSEKCNMDLYLNLIQGQLFKEFKSEKNL